MPTEAEAVAEMLRAAGIDAVAATDSNGPVVTLNPGDATTFLEYTGTGPPMRTSEAAEIISSFAATCPHSSEDECHWCGYTGSLDRWPAADGEHNNTCLWARANKWARRHLQ
jgi:hypothetical protein